MFQKEIYISGKMDLTKTNEIGKLYTPFTNHENYLPPKDAATATDPATVPAALATAANPVAPITGIMVPSVGANALRPAAIAGAANPDS